MARMLIVEEDESIRWALRTLLEHAYYDVETATSQAEAIALINENTYQLVLTDSFTDRAKDVLASLRTLRDCARPTPIAVISAWNIKSEDIEGDGFAFVQSMPFDVDHLLAQIAAALNLPLTPEQERQAAIVRRYFAALSSCDWDGLVDLCVPDVLYTLPAPTPFAGVQVGREAFRSYTIETFAQFPGARFHDVQVYASPSGLASRYQGLWQLPDGTQAVMSGAVYFEFDGELIKQIGVDLSDDLLRALLEAPHGKSSSSHPSAE